MQIVTPTLSVTEISIDSSNWEIVQIQNNQMDFSLYFNGIHINMKGISEAQYVFLEWNHIYNISLYHNYTKYLIFLSVIKSMPTDGLICKLSTHVVLPLLN